MGPIKTVKERCRKCYACVRNCPVKAIKVKKHYAEVIHTRCIGCGKCIAVCTQKAKVIEDSSEETRQLLAAPQKTIAVLGCSFPAFFHDITSGQLVSGLKRLGFNEVHEGSIGVEMIAPAYNNLVSQPSDKPLITTHCPTIVDLIERHYPQMLKNLMPTVSPMVAIGRYLKKIHGDSARVVYISSCIAGKFEIAAEQVSGVIDAVLTYKELSQMFHQQRIDLTRLGNTPFDGLKPTKGSLFPVTGGPFQVFNIQDSFFQPRFVSAEGEENSLEIIRDLAAGRITARLVDIRFCNGGCIGGPGRNNRLTTFAKRTLIHKHYENDDIQYNTADCYTDEFPEISFERTFRNKHKRLDLPSGDSIRKILHHINKDAQENELDCGACGYDTCRELAIAVHQGLADTEMCLPYALKRHEEDRVILSQKYELAKHALSHEFGELAIVGKDVHTIEVLNLIRQVGPTPTTVLIRGESGTGKELTARGIHKMSQRTDKTLVTLNCTTLTDSLMESELFGHTKGSFTGALTDKKGLFEAANGGTIFLDEIGDITPKLQAELLRVLDSGEIRPVGGNSTKQVDVRLIAATNKNLEQGVQEGWFREDLFYRLNVFSITMPPLRSRLDSLDELVEQFLRSTSKRVNKNIDTIDSRAIQAMRQYRWPGNIRELQNIIERAAVLTQDNCIHLENLPVVFTELIGKHQDEPNSAKASFRHTLEKQITLVEKGLLKSYLCDAGGNVSEAARAAQLPRRSLYRLLERHNLKGENFKPTPRTD